MAQAPPGVEVYIGLGSNLGRPQERLLAGVEGLKRTAGYRHLALSSAYVTAPVGKTDQPAFVNAVARGVYGGSAQDLLRELLAVEAAQGRERQERWGPRTLDLDLLLFGREVIDEPGLKVPHPEMARRAFVLVPLMELAPDLVLPVWGRTAGQLLAQLTPREREEQKVERVAWAC